MRKSRTPAARVHLRQLRTAFDAAFRKWAVEVVTYQSDGLTPGGSPAAMENAHSAYQNSRNDLAEFMLACPAGRRSA